MTLGLASGHEDWTKRMNLSIKSPVACTAVWTLLMKQIVIKCIKFMTEVWVQWKFCKDYEVVFCFDLSEWPHKNKKKLESKGPVKTHVTKTQERASPQTQTHRSCNVLESVQEEGGSNRAAAHRSEDREPQQPLSACWKQTGCSCCTCAKPCLLVFIATLSVVARNWNQSRFPSTGKLRYICTMEHYSALKKEQLLIHTTTWMNF